MNNDGFLDVVGVYVTKPYAGIPGGQSGSTLFLNDGTGAFQVVDGSQLLAAVTTTPPNGQRWSLGRFVPTVVTPQRTEGIVYESVGGCGLGFCAAWGLNVYKVVANGSIGTGPGFRDSESMGAPGFNEFFYLRHYPDAAATVQAGEYASGLAHYLAVGRARGYPSSAAAGVPTSLTAAVNGSSVTLSWSAPPNVAVTSYVLEAGSAPGLSNLARVPTGSTATSLSTSGVASGTYYMRVKTMSGTVTSGPSNEVVVTVGSGRARPRPRRRVALRRRSPDRRSLYTGAQAAGRRIRTCSKPDRRPVSRTSHDSISASRRPRSRRRTLPPARTTFASERRMCVARVIHPTRSSWSCRRQLRRAHRPI